MNMEHAPHLPPSVAGTSRATARLTFEGVTRRFETLSAVHEVDLELAAGEVLCLLGPSGCGKTTLLRIAAGLERQNSGRVLIDGEEVGGPQRFIPPEQRGVGLMFQDYALFPHLTIAENTAFGITGTAHGDAASLAAAALERVGLKGFAEAYPHRLSGGEQQRAALARAIAPRPCVLLMDEPFSGLDRSLRENVRDDTMLVLKESGASSILVTHDPEEAMVMGDRIALMRAGRLVQVGSPRDLYRHAVDADAARFFSEVNEFSSAVEGSHIETPLGNLPAGDAGTGQVRVLIREHDVHLTPSGEGQPACVAALRFIGEVTRVDVVLSNSGETVRLRVPGMVALTPGDIVGVKADLETVHIFPTSHDTIGLSADSPAKAFVAGAE